MKRPRAVDLGGRRNDRGTLKVQYLPYRGELQASFVGFVRDAVTGREINVRHLVVSCSLQDVISAAAGENVEVKRALEQLANPEPDDELEPGPNFVMNPKEETVH